MILPTLEPTIRILCHASVMVGAVAVYTHPESALAWGLLIGFIGINAIQNLILGYFQQIGLLKQPTANLTIGPGYNALYDPLTGLPNRQLLEDRTTMAIEIAKRSGRMVALLFIDLDNFKQINDARGHKAGDQVLVRIGSALKNCLRQSDTPARWGGDEFVVLLPELENSLGARFVAEKLAHDVHRYLQLNHIDDYLTMSIGIAVYPDDADSCDTLLMQADKALFYAKSQGRNNIQLYSDMHRQQLGFRDFDLTNRLVDAIKGNRIDVHYQPVIDAKTFMPIGVEALARWYDDKHGWVNPGLFIPMAENLGLIQAVGRQVLDRAFGEFSNCPVKDNLRMAVNISNRQLFSKAFYLSLNESLNHHGLEPKHIKLEITESTELCSSAAKACLNDFAEAGFYLSLDDFGTGFSSLSHLHDISVKELKIDMSFVRQVKVRSGRLFVKTIVDMGHALDLKLVAEGVEDLETAEILRDMGVEMLQGYYFRRGGTYEECAQYMMEKFSGSCSASS